MMSKRLDFLTNFVSANFFRLIGWSVSQITLQREVSTSSKKRLHQYSGHVVSREIGEVKRSA
jgi:hypothetical protein